MNTATTTTKKKHTTPEVEIATAAILLITGRELLEAIDARGFARYGHKNGPCLSFSFGYTQHSIAVYERKPGTYDVILRIRSGVKITMVEGGCQWHIPSAILADAIKRAAKASGDKLEKLW